MSGQVEAVQQALAPWAAPYLYLNFSDTSRDPASFWEADAYQRLRRVKSAVDPGDLIRSNHPIPPAEVDSGAGNWISRRRSAIRSIPLPVRAAASRVDPSARTLCRAP